MGEKKTSAGVGAPAETCIACPPSSLAAGLSRAKSEAIAAAVAELQAGGFAVHQHRKPGHLRLRGHNIDVVYWPVTRTAFAYGRTFKAAAQTLVEMARAGAIALPDEAERTDCRGCGSPAYQVHTRRGHHILVERDGAQHRCGRTRRCVVCDAPAVPSQHLCEDHLGVWHRFGEPGQ